MYCTPNCSLCLPGAYLHYFWCTCKQFPTLQVIIGVELSITNNPGDITAGDLVKKAVCKSWSEYSYCAALWTGTAYLTRKKFLHLFYFIFCFRVGGSQVWFAINCNFMIIEGKKVQFKYLGYHTYI